MENQTLTTTNNLPCKDCITKAICRNELYKTLSEMTFIYTYRHKKEVEIITDTTVPIRYHLYNKCSILQEFDEKNRYFFSIKELIIEEFNIDIQQIKNEYSISKKKIIQDRIDKGYKLINY